MMNQEFETLTRIERVAQITGSDEVDLTPFQDSRSIRHIPKLVETGILTPIGGGRYKYTKPGETQDT